MLHVNPELVNNIILRIREFQSKEAVVIPQTPPNPSDDYDWAQVLADHVDDLTYQELYSTIEDLEPDQQYEIVALLLLGRGDYSVDDFDSAFNEAKNIEPDHISQYILSVPLAASYLKEGLIMLGYESEV